LGVPRIEFFVVFFHTTNGLASLGPILNVFGRPNVFFFGYGMLFNLEGEFFGKKKAYFYKESKIIYDKIHCLW